MNANHFMQNQIAIGVIVDKRMQRIILNIFSENRKTTEDQILL